MDYISFKFLEPLFIPEFRQYLEMRKHFFVDQLGWNVPHNDEIEMDQYDNPCALYVLAVCGDEVVGGLRIMPTTAKWGKHCYMLRDALRGHMSIPPSVISEELVTEDVWECTRLVLSDALTDRSEILRRMLMRASELVWIEGGKELISLSPKNMGKVLTRLGFDVEESPTSYKDPDGRSYAMLRMRVFNNGMKKEATA